MNMRWAWLLVIPGAALVWLACNALAGIDEPVVQNCVSADPPSPPQVQDTGDGGVVIALRNLQFGTDVNDAIVAAAPGYNLDSVCTCPDEPSCKPAFADHPSCDLAGGRDNAFIDLYSHYSALVDMGAVNQNIDEGKSGFVFTLEHYNGTDNDPLVTVSLLRASKVLAPPDAGPAWNGHDVWNVDVDGYAAGWVPRYQDTTAYVSDGMLVSRLPAAILAISMMSVAAQLDVVDAIVTARISSPEGGPLTISDGQLAGRIPVSSLLTLIAQMPYLNGVAICQQPEMYETIRVETCKRADTLHVSTGSNAAPCDALSFALAFDGVQAQLGTPEPVQKPDAGVCPPGLRSDCLQVDE